MFEKKCAAPPQRLGDLARASTNENERAALSSLRCPSGAPLKYRTSRPPLASLMTKLALGSEQLWVCDHVLSCTRCNAEVVAAFSRPGDQSPPGNVHVRSKPRPDRYVLQHVVLPRAVFSNPSDTIRRLIDDGPQFGDQLYDLGCRQLRMVPSAKGAISKTHRLNPSSRPLAVAIEFEPPRSGGEAYFALVALKSANDAPNYYLCERTMTLTEGTVGAAGMLSGWFAGDTGEPDVRASFGGMSRVDLHYFVEAALMQLN
jgi:hypothetical protein